MTQPTGMTADPPPMRAKRIAMLAIFGVFFCESFVLGNWIPRIPSIKANLALSDGQLGLALFVLAGGTLLAFVGGTGLIKAVGLRKACAWSIPAWALSMMLAALAPSGLTLGMALLAAGIGIGVLEIAMNTAADEYEVREGKRVMSRAHGFWSVGSLLGAACGTAFVWLDVGVASHFLIVMPLVSVLGFWVSGYIVENPHSRSSEPREKAPIFQLPGRAIALLCIMPIGVMLVEGAFIDWSALFVVNVLGGSGEIAGIAFICFAAMMSVTRLSGDWLLDRFGAFAVAQVSTVLATLGIALFAQAPSVPVALLGALLSGAGVAIVYPLSMTHAARRPGDATQNVASMSLFSFCSFMLAPPLIGFISDATDLRFALTLLIPLAFCSLLLTRELKR
ncbi:MAG: MFS transporter [Pseudomonadota bacterium]